MDFLWILIAFCFGLLAQQLALPPLIGFLLAGFVLNYAGLEATPMLDDLANLGITLMLFTIGLKLDLRTLIRKEVWGSTLVQSSAWVALGIAALPVPTWLGVSHVFEVDLRTAALVAFALSFSSTVAVVKMLEEASELKVRHGRLALGILIVQDIIAVAFLVAATGKIPSVWASALLLLPLVRPLLFWVMERSGHGELLPLTGLFLALGGYELFSALGVKGDLGALIMGILVAGHSKSSELYKTLMSFKDLFLIGFFLSIGFSALPTLEMIPITVGLTVLLIVKFILFYFTFILFGMSGRASYLTALALSNYSEFGLIVANMGVAQDWLADEWLVMIALAMSASFLVSSLLFRRAHRIYARIYPLVNRFERQGAHQSLQIPAAFDVLIVGMGRVGKGAYQSMQTHHQTQSVWGLESDNERAAQLNKEGFQVIAGDADDLEVWQQASGSEIRLVMLALPSQQEMLATLQMMRLAGYTGHVAAVARYEDERKELLALGVDVVFNYYAEVGTGFAEEARHLLGGSQ